LGDGCFQTSYTFKHSDVLSQKLLKSLESLDAESLDK